MTRPPGRTRGGSFREGAPALEEAGCAGANALPALLGAKGGGRGGRWAAAELAARPMTAGGASGTGGSGGRCSGRFLKTGAGGTAMARGLQRGGGSSGAYPPRGAGAVTWGGGPPLRVAAAGRAYEGTPGVAGSCGEKGCAPGVARTRTAWGLTTSPPPPRKPALPPVP